MRESKFTNSTSCGASKQIIRKCGPGARPINQIGLFRSLPVSQSASLIIIIIIIIIICWSGNQMCNSHQPWGRTKGSSNRDIIQMNHIWIGILWFNYVYFPLEYFFAICHLVPKKSFIDISDLVSKVKDWNHVGLGLHFIMYKHIVKYNNKLLQTKHRKTEKKEEYSIYYTGKPAYHYYSIGCQSWLPLNANKD